MMEEIQKLMKCFPGSFINQAMEVVLNRKTGTCFSIKENMSREDVLCKIFEWCSRDCSKSMPYRDWGKSRFFRDSMCLSFSKYIGKVLDQQDFYWIYDRLGNAVNHELTLKFIAGGMDTGKLLRENRDE